jgi:type VI secretion system secreted protein VgrG
MAYTQDERPLRVSTSLGKDVFLLERFSGEEHISAPYRFNLEMLSEKVSIDPDTVLRKPVSVTLVGPGGEPRYFHGIVNRFATSGRRAGLSSYRAEIVPWLWFLSLTNDCRIFQNLSAVEIVTKVFDELGYTDYKLKVMGTPPKRVYCVQYRESSLAFVSRLLEDEGIFYFFEHTEQGHTLVLTDVPMQMPPCPGVSEIRMAASASYRMAEEPLVTSVELESLAITEKYELTDYDFEKPSASLRSAYSWKDREEIYDYPGNYSTRPDGDRAVRLRLYQKESEREVLRGESNAPSLTGGHLFDLTDHPNRALNQRYYMVRVRHAASIPNYTSSAGEFEYVNSFDAISLKIPYYPPLVTPRPRVYGSQTAVVVGPGGEEIYVDKYGRVKVQFFWDRQGKKDANSSCWVRVSSAWAGKNWGFIQIPRIGQEVIVDFLEGDPDRPIITGRVYNADQMPPYALPANMTQSGVLTRSTKGGSASTANEIRFEDKKGSEQLFIHAEKNEDHEVENDRTKSVGHDEKTTVGNDRTEHVKHNESIEIDNDRQESVGGNESISIGGSRSEAVDGDESITIGGSRTESVGKAESITIGAGRSESVAKDESVDIGGGREVTIGKDETLSVGGARTTQVGKNDTLQISKKLVVDVGEEITIKTGDAAIVMKKNGDIVIKGKNITLQGSGKINAKADGDVVLKGSKVTAN